MNAYATLREIQHDLFRGTITCEDLVRHHLSVIKQHAHLNAFLSVYEADALAQAAVINQKISSGNAGKLAGLIVGLKDVLSYKDHPLQAGSRILDGFTAQYNATAVQRLLDEDAIIIGRQNCDEFGMGSSNENSAFGAVKNGINPDRVPGGSSGGSAVAVQMGMCRISIGSDTGGSVRQPAAFCGVIGLKPTYSRISRYGLVAYASSFDCIGILGTSTEDVARVLEVMAGADAYDSTVSTLPVPKFSDELQLGAEKKYRVAYIRETVESAGLQPEIKDALQHKLNRLKQDGHTIEAIDFPLLEYSLPTYYILATAEASSNLSRYDGVRYGYRSTHTTDLQSLYKKSRTEAFGKEVQRRILLGTFVLSASYYDAYYSQAQKVRQLIRQRLLEIFRQYDFILLPTAPTTAFALGANTTSPLQMYLADLYSVVANVSGIPGISVPCGNDHLGLPIGLQVLAGDFQESALLRFSNLLMKLD